MEWRARLRPTPFSSRVRGPIYSHHLKRKRPQRGRFDLGKDQLRGLIRNLELSALRSVRVLEWRLVASPPGRRPPFPKQVRQRTLCAANRASFEPLMGRQ
jgi:hypothetical protein